MRLRHDADRMPRALQHLQDAPHDPEANGPAPTKQVLSLPPLFRGLAEEVEFFFGEVGERRSLLRLYEVQYGAEATIYLKSKRPNDTHAGLGHNLIRYVSEHDGRPVLYGHDVVTEGLRVRCPEDRLRDLWLLREAIHDRLDCPTQTTDRVAFELLALANVDDSGADGLADDRGETALDTPVVVVKGAGRDICPTDQRTNGDRVVTLLRHKARESDAKTKFLVSCHGLPRQTRARFQLSENVLLGRRCRQGRPTASGH